MRRQPRPSQLIRWWRFSAAELNGPTIAWTLVLFAIATGAAFLSQSYGKTLTAPLVYLLGVTVIGATQGLLPGVAAALTASLIYNFAITDPIFVFRLTDADDLVPLVAFNLSALIAGSLAGRLKDMAAEAQRASRELSKLLEASKVLQGILSLGDLAAALPGLGRLADVESMALLITGDGAPRMLGDPSAAPLQQTLIEELDKRQTARLPRAEIDGWLVLVLSIGPRLEGALLVRAAAVTAFLGAFANLIAITVERCKLLDQLASSKAVERSEAFKTALLSSVSHDMRTPLSAISASASSLLEYEDRLGHDVRTRLLNTIREQCERLNRYTSNLLNLGRAQGDLSPEKMPIIDVVEVLGRAVNGIRGLLEGRELLKRLPAGPVFVRADGILLEQVFHNILENAILYSDAPSRIEVGLEKGEAEVSITITDQGIGIPKSELERIFERFYRLESSAKRSRGNGLGLAIAKAFTEAVGGRISAESPVTNARGTRVTICLPLYLDKP